MKKLYALFLVLTMVLCAACATADATVISVTGTSTVSCEPDMVSLSAGVNANAATLSQAQREMSMVIESVKNALLDLGLTEDCLTTTNYSCFPQYDSEGMKVAGYSASHTLNIRCNQIELLDAIVTVLSENGINSLYAINFDVADKSSMYEQAMTEAVAAATAKAEVLAKAMGKSTVIPTSVSESQTSNYGFAFKSSSADMNINTEIHSGSVNVTASVEMVFSAQ